MLFVFHVDCGKMMRFEMNLALESVTVLKQHILEVVGIPVEKQVLLINGGECLDSEKRVCSYSAGTDTNPIFLFSKALLECPITPQIAASADHGFSEDLQHKVKEYCDLPVTLSTVTRRAQLAQHFHELARELQTICENVVHDQHLQQQGWAAVIANLDDIVIDFRKRLVIFEQTFKHYMDYRESYVKFLSNFENDLEILKRIPVLDVLLGDGDTKQNFEGEGGGVEAKTTEETATGSNVTGDLATSTGTEVNIYEWMASSDNRATLNKVYEDCKEGLENFNGETFERLKEEVYKTLDTAETSHMKEIRGLSERLIGLDNLLREAKDYVRQQADLAQAFINNQSRANNTKDTSVLPDLCISHRKQLIMMSKNHQALSDIKRRVLNSKHEFSANLNTRLRWVMFVEQQLSDLTMKLMSYHENLKKLQKFLDIVQQIHLSPMLYLNAVAEVVRRREFSQAFLLWSSELACHMLTIHNEEVARRKEFFAQFETHFLHSLFPGIQDVPPPFATQAPPVFDTNLPKLTEDDVERLRRRLPDLAEHLNVPDLSAVMNFFLTNSFVNKKEDGVRSAGAGGAAASAVVGASEAAAGAVDEAVKDDDATGTVERIVEDDTSCDVVSSNVECEKAVRMLPHLKDLDRGCESETDTEEFEKVCQSPLEPASSPRTRTTTQDVSTLTEDNLQTSKSEHEKLTSVLIKLHYLSKEGLGQLRLGLSEIKTQVLGDRTALSQSCESLSSSWENLIVERDSKEKEYVDMLKKSYETEIDQYKLREDNRQREIERLKLEKEVLESDIVKTNETLNELRVTFDRKMAENAVEAEELQKQLRDKEDDRERVLKETVDRLNREHKAEIESIRSRFKLMTMEKSPSSESHMEKSGDFSSLPNPSFLMQMTENFEMDKERAVNEALVRERSKWEKILDIKIQGIEAKFEAEKEMLLKQVSEEKERQIDELRERERILSLECVKYKDTIQQLAETEKVSYDSDLLEKLNALQKEKDLLEEELEQLRRSRSSADSAFSEGKVDVTTSPIREQREPSTSSSKSDKVGHVRVDQCKAGDHVVVMWDPAHENFRILQENKHKYFLHSDCLESLNLEIVDGKPNRMYCVGEVVDKEYCHARKSENRYKVPKGSKFFRVKVRLVGAPTTSKELSQSTYHSAKFSPPSVAETTMSQSQCLADPMLESTVVERFSGSDSLPSSPPKYPPSIQEQDESDMERLPTDTETTEHGVSDKKHIPSGTEHVVAGTEPMTVDMEQVTAGAEQVTVDTEHVASAVEHKKIEEHFAEDSGFEPTVEQAKPFIYEEQNKSEPGDR